MHAYSSAYLLVDISFIEQYGQVYVPVCVDLTGDVVLSQRHEVAGILGNCIGNDRVGTITWCVDSRRDKGGLAWRASSHNLIRVYC